MADYDPTFPGMPEELKAMVLDYVLSKRDVKALCLTCKWLRHLATPRLYRAIILPVEAVNGQLRSILNSNNLGLKHTTEIRLEDSACTGRQVRNLDDIVHLVRSLPQDNLLSFEISTWETVPENFVAFVCKQQTKLEHFLLARQSTDFCPSLDLLHVPFHSLSSVVLILDSIEDAKRGCHVLTNVVKLRDLCVTRTPRHSGVLSVTLMGELFKPWMTSSRPRKRLAIQSIYLQRLECDHLSQVLWTAIDFHAIRMLELHKCGGVDPFLEILSTQSLKLEMFGLYKCDTGADVFNTFLRTLTDLRHLQTNWAGHGANQFVAHLDILQRLGSKLRTVSIEACMPYNDVVAKAELMSRQFQAFCTACPAIQQLSAFCPPHLSDATGSGEVHFEELLSCLLPIKDLVALKLCLCPSFFGWYSAPYEPDTDKRNAALEAYTRDKANVLFSALKGYCRKLTALSIHCYAPGSLSRGPLRTFYFLRKVRVHVDGELEIYGQPVTEALFKAEEPYNEIFNEY